VPDGYVAMTFRLYNADTGGIPLWEESHTAVPVEDGLFHVLLGSIEPIPVSVLVENSILWLGITVGADGEMVPREQVASVPYAMIASTVLDGSITTDKIADGAVTQDKLDPGVIMDPLYGFGGMYTDNPHTGACQGANPFTRVCTCPPGFSSQVVATIPHSELGYDCNGLVCYTRVCYKQATVWVSEQ